MKQFERFVSFNHFLFRVLGWYIRNKSRITVDMFIMVDDLKSDASNLAANGISKRNITALGASFAVAPRSSGRNIIIFCIAFKSCSPSISTSNLFPRTHWSKMSWMALIAALCSLGRVCLVNEERTGGGRGERAAQQQQQQQRASHQRWNPGIKANLARMRKNNLLRFTTW